MTRLTGKRRYRAQKSMFGPTILVLQVEEVRGDGPMGSNGMPEHLACTYWRDARVEDLIPLSEERK